MQNFHGPAKAANQNMTTAIDHLKRDIDKASSVGEIIDATHDVMRRDGLDAVIYDFAPIATTPEGDLAIPTHLSHRNVPADMRHLWCEEKYHQSDPVQQIALKKSAPFAWSYRDNGENSALANHLKDEHTPVSEYLHDTGLTCGITVPLHRTSGGFATFTAIQRNAAPSFLTEAHNMLHRIGLIGQLMHEATLECLTRDNPSGVASILTNREIECLQLSAQGFTAKEIAEQIGRSVPTATLHLKSAMAKLGARNRAHAVALAMHFRVFEL